MRSMLPLVSVQPVGVGVGIGVAVEAATVVIVAVGSYPAGCPYGEATADQAG